MLSPEAATYLLVFLLIFLLVLLPALEAIPVIGDHVSRRFVLTSILLATSVAAIVDFSHLETNVRLVVVIGGFSCAILTIVMYSLEKTSFARIFGLKKVDASWVQKTAKVEFETPPTPKLEVEQIEHKSDESKS